MIQHLTSLPVLLPMLAAIILLLPPCGKNLFARRLASGVMAIITFVVSVLLLITVHNEGINTF